MNLLIIYMLNKAVCLSIYLLNKFVDVFCDVFDQREVPSLFSLMLLMLLPPSSSLHFSLLQGNLV